MTFMLLVKLTAVPNFVANFASSYVGVTFVWFASLKVVFQRSDERRNTFLLVYWCFQFVSIMVYSQLLHLVADALIGLSHLRQISHNPDVAAKIIITPFNLVTNFIFMKFLTCFMHKEYQAHV